MWKRWLTAGAVVFAVMVVAGVVVFAGGGDSPSSFTEFRDGCPHSPSSSSAVDWVPFVRHEGRMYYEQTVRADEPQLTEQSLVRTVGTVECMLGDEVQDPDYQPRDGDAAYLASGTQLWSVPGFDPSFRLVAETRDRLLLFETWPEGETGTGRDIYGNLDTSAVGIAINAESDGETTLGRIDKPETVRALIADLLDGPLTSDHQGGVGDRYFLEIEFEGAPPVNVVLFVDEQRIHPGLVVSQRFIDAIVASVDAP